MRIKEANALTGGEAALLYTYIHIYFFFGNILHIIYNILPRHYICHAGVESGLCPGDADIRCCLHCDDTCQTNEEEWGKVMLIICILTS